MIDVERIRRRANRAHEWLKSGTRQVGEDEWLPLSVREHFDHDVPQLLAELERYQELHDDLDEAARGAEPVMLAESVIESTTELPVAWPAVPADVILRALSRAERREGA